MERAYKNPKILFDSLKKGDELGYSYLVDTYKRKLFAYALSLTNDHDLAQDIVQNVFIKTWEHRKKLNPKHSIQSFLYKSIYNDFINQYWKDQSKRTLETEYVTALNQIVEETDNSTLKKLTSIVLKEIENLPPKCKKVFLLSKKEGLTNIEISDHLNISIKSVEGHISKGYSIIRKKIDVGSNIILFILMGAYNNNNSQLSIK